MPLEDLTGSDKFPVDLNPAWPVDTDQKREGDDHLRGIKNVFQNTFPSLDGPVDFNGADMTLGIQNGLDHTVPIGGIIMLAQGSSGAPANWLLCDGAAVSRTTYATLFALIGDNYGVGDGSTTFNLPNMDGRAPQGSQVGGPFRSEFVGAETHTLTAAESGLPAHNDHYTFRSESGPDFDRMAAGTEQTPRDRAEDGSNEDNYTVARTAGLTTEPNIGRVSPNDAKDAAEAHPIVGPRLVVAFVIRAL